MLILLFGIFLILTFLVSRVGAQLWHDFEAYEGRTWKGRHCDKSKTPTGWLRRKTGKDLHHIHIGFFILVILTPMIIMDGLGVTSTIFLAIGVSLVLDQIFAFLSNGDYFSRAQITISMMLHIAAYITFILFDMRML